MTRREQERLKREITEVVQAVGYAASPGDGGRIAAAALLLPRLEDIAGLLAAIEQGSLGYAIIWATSSPNSMQ